MKLLNRLERKLGKYAIPNLIKYVIVLYALGLFVRWDIYEAFFSLNVPMILRGQIWRLITFIIYPRHMGGILFLAIELYLYYMIGNALERAWGSFRFNLYFLSGIIFQIIAAFLIYFITGVTTTFDLTYINRSMFFAFAVLYPNMQFLLYFFIPVKVKYLAYLYGAIILYQLFGYIIDVNAYAISIIMSLANFLIFFFATRNYKRVSYGEYQRKAKFRSQMREARGYQTSGEKQQGKATVTRHKCAVCGRTEQDDDQLEFRFCSKCDGNYEYCMEHLFTHEHVKK